MSKLKISNAIFEDLLKLKLVKKANIQILFNKTRDKNIRVLQDKKTKVIFLEKNVINQKNYQKTPNQAYFKTFDRKKKKIILEDDIRRFNQFKKIIKNKEILDYGCGWGGFLNLSRQVSKKSSGYEIMLPCLKYINKNNFFQTYSNKNSLKNKKFDLIFLFHVLEHLPNQISELTFLKKLLKKNGKIIIEVPHAKDKLISNKELVSFKNFTFWSEHLILHTKYSLKKFLKSAGFKKIQVQNFQRYNLNNHLNWFINNKPNGHNKPLFNVDNKTLKKYENFLITEDATDTIIAYGKI